MIQAIRPLITASVLPRRIAQRFRSSTILRYGEHGLALIGACFIIYSLCFELTVMTSGSMSPTLRGSSYDDGDRILLEKVTGRFRFPRRWEVYFFYNGDGVPVAKRIVGLPGEKISMKENQLFINGLRIRPPQKLAFLKYYPFGNLTAGREVSCGEGYYVLGDDSRDSYDSRFLGPVRREEFRGRVWCILWPFARAGFVR
jgi:signal peptidase I